MKRITTNPEKLEIVKELVAKDLISFDQALLLLEVEVETKIDKILPTLPGLRNPFIPNHNQTIQYLGGLANPAIYPNPNPSFPAFSNGRNYSY